MTLRRRILALSFVSGVCGLAYEVLYTRLLSTYLGDMLQVSAATLACFLTGIGVGSLWARRVSRWLWAIEAGIGCYGIVLAVAVPAVSDVILRTVLPLTAESH